MGPAAAASREIRIGRREAFVLAAMSLMLGLVVLDETVVGFALQVMRRDLGMSMVGSQWVVNAYLLALARGSTASMICAP